MKILSHLGFIGFSEFFNSLLRPKLIAKAWALWLFTAPLFAIVEKALGMTGPLFMSFILLNLAELFTGIKASMVEGKAIASDKLQRFFIKFSVYVVIIGSTFQYKVFTMSGTMDSAWASEFFSWAHSGILSGLSIILIRSIFENLHRMGVKEAGIIYGILDNKWTRFVAILFAPPDKEKSER